MDNGPEVRGDRIDFVTHRLDGRFHYVARLREQMANYQAMFRFCRRLNTARPTIDPCVFYWIP
jgi:hypothetical protein